MEGCPSPAFSWWIESKFHKPSGLCFHRIIYFQVSRAVCFSHNRSFLPFPHTCQLLSASAVIYGLLPNCMTEFWKCVRVQQLEKPAAIVNVVLPLPKSKWAQEDLTHTLCYYTDWVQGGKTSTIGPIFIVYFKCIMLHICKWKRCNNLEVKKHVAQRIDVNRYMDQGNM